MIILVCLVGLPAAAVAQATTILTRQVELADSTGATLCTEHEPRTTTPEGNLVGTPCDTVRQTNGVAGAVWFLKDGGTGTDNTGWVTFQPDAGSVDTSGTPANDQVAIFTDADTIEGDTDFVFDGTQLGLGGTPAALFHINRDDTTRTDIQIENNDLTADAEIGRWLFRALDASSAVQDYAAILGVIDSPTAASEDGRIAFETAIDGTLATRMTLDQDRLGIGITTPDGTLHAHTATAGTVTADTSANQIVAEDSDTGGMSILVPDASTSQFLFGSPTDNKGAQITWAHDSNQLQIGTHKTGGFLRFDTGIASEDMRIDGGNVFINDTANANMTIGLTVNQGANDNEIQAFKSSDIAHGLTTGFGINIETDNFAAIQKRNATLGGVRHLVIAEDAVLDNVWSMHVLGGQGTNNKTTSLAALVEFNVAEHNGANVLANITPDGNVFAIRARVGGSAVARFMIDEDGDMFTVTAGQTFDEFEDAKLARAFDLLQEGTVASEWDRYIDYNEQALIDAGILGAPIADGGMWNLTGHVRLLNGAVWQNFTAQQEMALRLTRIEEENAALRDDLRSVLAILQAQEQALVAQR